MADDHAMEQEFQAQAMDAELHRAGKRAGAVAAAAEWPRVERSRQRILTKAKQATIELFGARGAARNLGYGAGWVDGYALRCVELGQQVAS
jgi:hypothetical protein